MDISVLLRHYYNAKIDAEIAMVWEVLTAITGMPFHLIQKVREDHRVWQARASSNWKPCVAIKHLVTEGEDHKSLQASMNALTDVLDRDD